MKKSTFYQDLNKEKELGVFLNQLYRKHLKHYTFLRETNQDEQHKGVDLVFTNKQTGKKYFIDEKAQLDYLNEDLPTFAFELYYKKQGNTKEGWLFDQSKKTDFYALVTGIFTDAPNTFTTAKITLVNRQLLWKLLKEKGLNQAAFNIPSNHGKKDLSQLNPKTEGYLYFSKTNKAEQPVNLVLRLEFLLQSGVAKRLV